MSWHITFGRLISFSRDSSAAANDIEGEPLHPKENPILQGYLLPGDHDTYRRYVLELLVVLGLLLPWIGPLFGLAVMTPIVLLTVEDGKIITTETDCFGGGQTPSLCPAQSYFDYYFWNITNPLEFLAGSGPPVLKEIGPYVFLVQETRWNVAFTSDFSSVNYSYLDFQTFVPEASCAGCSLTGDVLITVNRGYLAFLNLPVIQQNDALAFIPYVPTAIRQIVAAIEAVFIAGGAPAAYVPSLAVSQWGRAAYGYPTPDNPSSTEFANWVYTNLGFPKSAASSILTDSQSATLLDMFAGTPARDSPGSLDGALNVELFAFYPAAVVQSTLNAALPSLGLTISQIQLLQGYIYWVCRNFVVPSALYGGFTGQLLGGAAGGLLVRRSVYDWIYGWKDPLLQHNVSLGFAWPANDTASAVLGKPTSDLEWQDSPLIFQYNISTGRTRDGQPYNAIMYGGNANVRAYPATPLPNGTLLVHGSAGGLSFPLNIHPKTQLTMFDATFNRPLNVSFTGAKTMPDSVSAWLFHPVDGDLAGCSSSSPIERCAYPDLFSHTFNASLTYACPTLLSFPHFYKADPVLAESTGFTFNAQPSLHEWTFSVEPVTGYTLTGSKGYQISHLLRRSTFLYSSLWLNDSSEVQGMWLPTHWVRSRFEPTASSAKALRNGLALRESFRIYPAYVVPSVFAALLAFAIILLRFTPAAKRSMSKYEQLAGSKARTTSLDAQEAVQVAHLADNASSEVMGGQSSIMLLEERFGQFWDSNSESHSSSPRSFESTPRYKDSITKAGYKSAFVTSPTLPNSPGPF